MYILSIMFFTQHKKNKWKPPHVAYSPRIADLPRESVISKEQRILLNEKKESTTQTQTSAKRESSTMHR